MSSNPPPNMEVEKVFNAFVKDFGGELVSDTFPGNVNRPLNADYFFSDRTIVAELKCLEKDYHSSKEIGEKTTLLINEWMAKGLLRPEQIKNGRFQTDDLPHECGQAIFRVFSAPVKKAVEKANQQIKATKNHFHLPNAHGLLILANDGNYSLNPKLSMQILAHLLPKKYTSIDSFIYFTPNMMLGAPQYDRQFHVWISGPSRPSANTIETAYLAQIQEGWSAFLAQKLGEEVAEINATSDSLQGLSFIR